MRVILFLLITTATWAGGWETSRFFILVNGARVGTFSVSRLETAQSVRTKTVSHLEIKRGGQTLVMDERNESTSRPDGTPVSLLYEMKQGALNLSFSADFTNRTIHIRDAGGTSSSLPMPDDLVLDHGTVQQVRNLINSDSKTATVHSLFPATRQPIPRIISYKGPVETEHGRFHKLDITDRLSGMELLQETLVDNTGRMVHAVSHIMGLEIRYVPETWDTGKSSGIAPDFLIETLFPADRYFPSGYAVKSLTFTLAGLPEQITPPTGPCQQVTQSDNGYRLTITRPELKPGWQAGNAPDALLDGPVVQTSLKPITTHATRIRRQYPEPHQQVQPVISIVDELIPSKGYGVGFDNTAGILDSGSGDCTEHSVLAIALLRALGIPGRAAAGLVSVNGIMGFHMWVEILTDSGWIPVDPTFRQKAADPSHIRLTHSLLNHTGFQTDLMPILPLISKLSLSPERVVLDDGRELIATSNRDPSCLPIPYWEIRPGEPFTWTGSSPERDQDRYNAGTARFQKDGIIMTLALADIKNRVDADAQVAELGRAWSPLSFEAIREHRVAFGWNGKSLAMFTVRDGTVLQFTFESPSDTIGTTLKERAYDICLKILSDGKRTDPDR